MECSIVEMRSLTQLSLLEPTKLQASIDWLYHDKYPETDVHVKASDLQIRLGPSAVHTLNDSALLWNQVPSYNLTIFTKS